MNLDQFESLWNSIGNNIGYFWSKIIPEHLSIVQVLHKYGAAVENFHYKVLKSLSVNTRIVSNINEKQKVKCKPSAQIEDIEYACTKSDEPLIINGIHYAIDNISKKEYETIRRQIDLYLLRLIRAIKLSVSYLKSVNSENAITMLIQQLTLLSDYISAANNRIIIQQIIDDLMEDLLKIKTKLVDFSLNYSKFFFKYRYNKNL